MKLYKNILNGYIVSISEGVGITEITESEYKSIIQKIWNKPTDPDGFQHKLRDDNLEWEMVELPEPKPVDEDADISDYENALADMGVRFGD